MFEPDVTDVNGIGAIGGLGLEPAAGAIPLTGTNDPLTGGMSPETLTVPTLGAENYETTVWPLDSVANGPPLDEDDGPIEGSPSSVDPLMGLVANGQGEPSISGLMDEAVEKVHSSLQELAAGPDLREKLTEAFGENGSKKAVEEVTPDWLTGNFSGLPELKVVSSAEIGEANGAYAEATDTIYISGEFLVENISSPLAVADVLLEEIGHHVDARVNVVDTEGDEGDIFSAVVQGKELGQPQIEFLRGEDDTAVVVIDGETLKIEKDDSFEAAWDLGTLSGTKGLNDYFSNGDANDYSRFYLPNTSNVNITLSGLSEDIDVQLLRDDGSFVDQSILGGDSDELISQVLDAGTYYVRVYPAFGSANSNYSLSLSADSLSGTTETQTNSSDEWVSYTVQSGDSLSQIALNTTGDANRYWDIADYNGIDDPSSIYVGQQIQIPGNNSTGTTVEVTTENNDEWEWYTVQSGDSLWDIAQRATGDGNRYWDIADYNGIDDPNSIYVGQQIQIPENNSTGTTVEVTTEGGSETSYGEFIQGFAEPREVDMAPTIQLVEQDWPDSYPDSYKITLDRIDDYGYIQNDLETWIVIHGWNDDAESFVGLADAIEGYDDGNYRQVLTLDWSGMAKTGRDNYLDLHDASVWIREVAETATEQLSDWNFDSNNINLVGHSLGAYVAYEISEQLGGVNNLVALDPALMTGLPTITGGGGYDIDQVDFSDHSQWSWSLDSSLAGNDNIARTADESFEVIFGATLATESHGAIKQLWVNMLDHPSGEISRYFGLEDISAYEEKPWPISDSGWEAKIFARDVFGFGSHNFSQWVPEMLQVAGGTSITETTNDFEEGGIMRAS